MEVSCILRIYDKEDAKGWNDCVKSFSNWDVYYLYEYAYSFMLHGDGEFFLVYYENNDEKFCYTVMQKDISECYKFNGKLEKGKYFDWETPYGHGGPLANGTISKDSQIGFLQEISLYCKKNNIVSQFVRFHPLLNNHEVLPYVIEARYLRDTIFIDTSSPELILKNMDSKNRNMIRKAKKNGVTIARKEIEDFEEFIRMYDETMKKNGADQYYSFQKKYFESLRALKENACIFYALFENQPISGSIIYYNDLFMHYHLSGSYTEFRKYSPSNLLLYEVACWASEKGIKRFHLGGGMSPDDSLFGFKKQFNKNGRSPFVVGRTIFDIESYNELLQIRKGIDPEFDINNELMIQYRR